MFGVRKELEKKKYVDDEEMLHSIEETVAMYRRFFLEKSHEKSICRKVVQLRQVKSSPHRIMWGASSCRYTYSLWTP